MTNRILRAAAATVTTLILLSPATAAEMKAKKEPTAAQMAARERMSKCSAEWKEAKMSGKVEVLERLQRPHEGQQGLRPTGPGSRDGCDPVESIRARKGVRRSRSPVARAPGGPLPA